MLNTVDPGTWCINTWAHADLLNAEEWRMYRSRQMLNTGRGHMLITVDLGIEREVDDKRGRGHQREIWIE